MTDQLLILQDAAHQMRSQIVRVDRLLLLVVFILLGERGQVGLLRSDVLEQRADQETRAVLGGPAMVVLLPRRIGAPILNLDDVDFVQAELLVTLALLVDEHLLK